MKCKGQINRVTEQNKLHKEITVTVKGYKMITVHDCVNTQTSYPVESIIEAWFILFLYFRFNTDLRLTILQPRFPADRGIPLQRASPDRPEAESMKREEKDQPGWCETKLSTNCASF